MIMSLFDYYSTGFFVTGVPFFLALTLPVPPVLLPSVFVSGGFGRVGLPGDLLEYVITYFSMSHGPMSNTHIIQLQAIFTFQYLQ